MERACMTPDQFFDQLDILFGANDGYIPHLGRIRALIEKNEELQEKNEELQEDIQQYKDTLNEHFHHYDLLKKKNDKLQEENEKLKAENKKQQERTDLFVGYFQAGITSFQELLGQSSEEGLEKKLDTGGWSPTSSPEPKQ